MSPLYQPGDTVYVADRLRVTGRPLVVRCRFTRMQGVKVVVAEGGRMYAVDPGRLFKTRAGARFLSLMEG